MILYWLVKYDFHFIKRVNKKLNCAVSVTHIFRPRPQNTFKIKISNNENYSRVSDIVKCFYSTHNPRGRNLKSD